MISIIVPTYNERENLAKLVDLIDKSINGIEYEIVVVDDDSPDGTWKLATELANRYPIRVIRRINERGLSTAVIEGFKQAKGDILVVMDADLQHPPEVIPRLVKPILEGKADLVIGSRYVRGGGVKEWGFIRKLVSKGAIFLAHMALPNLRGIKDPMSGFFAVKKNVIDGVELKPIGYKILLEILVKGKAGRIMEVPYIFGERAGGESKLGKKQIIDYVKHLWRLSIWTGDLWRIFKYVIVGLSGLFVNIGLLYFLVETGFMKQFLTLDSIESILNMFRMGVTDKVIKLIAGAISVEVSIIWNYIWNNVWTFRDRKLKGRDFLKGLIKFNTVSLGGLAINLFVYSLLMFLFNVYYIYSQIVAVFVAFAWNFIVNDIWTWRVRHKKVQK